MNDAQLVDTDLHILHVQAVLGPQSTEQARKMMWESLSVLGQVGMVHLGDGQAFDSMIDNTLFLVRPRG